MWTFLKWAFMIGLAAVIMVPLFKMGIDAIAGKVSALSPVASYVDKA